MKSVSGTRVMDRRSLGPSARCFWVRATIAAARVRKAPRWRRGDNCSLFERM